MLTPEYYETLTDDLIALYADLDEAIIKDITRRILKTGRMTESAKWQAKQLQESGFLYDDILSEIAKRTDATENHVRALFEDAGVKSVEIDNTFYHAAEISGIVKLSDAALQTMNAGYLKCSGNLKNLTLTTANTSQQAYINACNSAYMQVTSGAFDYNTAIRNAIKKCAEDGAYVLYPTGHRERIDVAVRRSVLTGVGQTCRELSKVNAEDMDCDIMEITAHAGARPSHAEWQGQLVSLSGKNAGKIIEGRRVLSLAEIGYGTGDGFGGWNCRHDWYPFFVGISRRAYSDERLRQLDERNIEYNGKKYNQYEISQIQRKFEREIRAAKREKVAFEVAVKEATDSELKQVMQDSLDYSKSVLSEKQAKMRDFIQQTGQLRDYSRKQNYGRVAYIKDSLTHSISINDLQYYKSVSLSQTDIRNDIRGSITVHSKRVNYKDNSLKYPIYVSDNVIPKPKLIHSVDYALTKALELLNETDISNFPTVIIMNNEEIQKSMLASYYQPFNILILDKDFIMANSEINKNFACPNKSISTVLHELIHWKDAEEYRRKYGMPRNQEQYKEYLNKKFKKTLDKLFGIGYNYKNISMYAYTSYNEENYFETYTEYRVKKLLKG